MAKADWCTVAPMSGNGDGTLTISAPAHTGRADRSTTVTVQNQNGTKPSASITVNQAGAPVTTTMDESKPDIPGSGGTVTINGTSNSKMLRLVSMILAAPGMTCSLRINDAAPFTLSPKNGISTVTIPGDPGALETYSFVITLVLSQSPMAIKQPFPLAVYDDTETFVRCMMYWLPGASAISVSNGNLAVPDAGGSDTVEVNSNDDWTVS